MNSVRAVVRGIGHAVPSKILTNDAISKLVDTSDEWITQRTGIKERRICGEGESSVSLSVLAARRALESAGMTPESLDLVVCATVTPDYIFPSSSCMIQDQIGATNAAAYDLGAACAGFIYALATASGMIASGQVQRVLVVGVDTLSKVIDWTDRSTCILFGDGAGAVVLEASDDASRGVLRTVLHSDGSGGKHIIMQAGGSLHPMCRPESATYRSTLEMAGSEVYRFAVNAMGDACVELLEKAGLEASEIDLFVPHQANLRIIESAKKRLGLPDEKVFINLHKYGNTSGGSIPMALSEAVQEGRLKPGMKVMTVGFGAGLVWGANLICW